ncbi:DUF4097 domain-containing protein [Acidobacteriota bacterium]
MKIKRIQICLFIIFLFLITIPSDAASQEETIEKTFQIDGTQSVDFEFSDNDGDVHFSTWNRNEVHILIHKEIKSVNGRKSERLLEETKVDVSQHNNTIRIRVRYPRIKGFVFISNSSRIKVTSEIKIPVKTNLDCRLDDGDITIEGSNGKLYLKADDGTVRVADAQGSIDGDTDDGRIILENYSGKASLDTDDGDILLSGNFSTLDLESDDGDILVKNLAESFMDNEWLIKTDDGDVDIYFTEIFSADFHIDTDDGRIESQLPVVFNETTSKKRLSGKIKDGGHLISIKTDDGDITLKEIK